MSSTVPPVLQRSLASANAWIDEVAEELGTDNRRDAYRALRGFLHVLRDRLTVDETAQLAAQLPVLVRGIFYEGWDPSGTPHHYADADAFLTELARRAGLHGTTEASFAAAAAYAVLARRITEGELVDVLAVLPREVRRMLLSATPADG